MATPAPAGSRDVPRLFDVRRNWKALTERPAFHDPVVDGVRAAAILWVMSYHLVLFHLGSFTNEAIAIATGRWTQWTSRGDMGVDLFFVISGYLIGTILLREYQKSGTLQIGRFYLRRFLRLIPVYSVAMIVGLYFVHNIPREAVLMEFPPFMNADNMWANFLYVNNFLPINRQYMGWCWSLAIEEQFYLILPGFFLIVLRAGKPLRLLGALLLAAGIIRWFVIVRHGFVPPFLDLPNMQSWVDRFTIEYQNLYTRYGALLSGVIGAYLMVFHREAVGRFFARTPLVNALGIASIAVIIPTGYFALSSPLFNEIPVWARIFYYSHHRDAFAVAVMFLVLAAIHSSGFVGAPLRRALSSRLLFPIAQISYSLYLVHEMFMLWLFPKTAALFGPSLGAYPTMALAALIAVAMSFAGATVLYLLVEQPSMRARELPAVRRLSRSVGFA
jgi:peptidoglycan/LPS O-acetylase OafA/YrhL